MISSDLEAVLSGWDEAVRGRKPHLMYTIPCGQNPTGSVMPSERYDEIYAICHKHDVIIMEDDPYFGESAGARRHCTGLIHSASIRAVRAGSRTEGTKGGRGEGEDAAGPRECGRG
jgi:aspartate/methionine/tyrosine aminotransferase